MHTVGINQTKSRKLNVSEVECGNPAEKLHVGNRCSARKADLLSLSIRSTCLIKFPPPSPDETGETISAFHDLHQFCFSREDRRVLRDRGDKKKSIARISVRFQPKLVSLNDFNKLDDDVEVRKNWPDYIDWIVRACEQTGQQTVSDFRDCLTTSAHKN